MVYYPGFVCFVDTEPLPLIFSLSKIICVFLLLVFFYIYFIRVRRKERSPDFFEKGEVYGIVIQMFKDRRIHPSVISIVVSNTGNREVDLEAPVLIFWNWTCQRKFRILSVGHSGIYPIYLEIGKASVVNVNLEQFYNNAPELRKAGRLSVELNEVNGRKFKSGKIRIKGW